MGGFFEPFCRPVCCGDCWRYQNSIRSLFKVVHKSDITKWVTSILAMMTHPEQQSKLNNVIKQTFEELLQCRLNIITSTDGHVHVTMENFNKKETRIYYKTVYRTLMVGQISNTGPTQISKKLQKNNVHQYKWYQREVTRNHTVSSRSGYRYSYR